MNKKLKLSSTNKVFAGVCGGIAEYFNADPTLIRIIWVILTIILNAGWFLSFVLYVICWAVMPLNDK